MNLWLAAALALLPALAVTGAFALRGAPVTRLIGLQLANLLAALIVLLFAAGTGQPWIADLALAQVLMSLFGALAYAHFLERWL